MEPDQIKKQLEWIDEEQRRSKTIVDTLADRITRVDGDVASQKQQLNDLTSEVTRLSALLLRLDQFESNLLQARVDFSRALENDKKEREEHEREVEKLRRAEMEGVNKSIGDLRRNLEVLADIKKSLQSRIEEEFRLGRLIDELEHKVIEGRRSDEDYKRAQKILEESRRQDAKRITDLIGEVAGLRKRVDEQRGKVDLVADNLRKLEARQSEIVNSEGERRQAQILFIEKQNLLNVERDKQWREWEARFSTVEKEASGIGAQLQALETTHRNVKRAQDAFEDITQRMERRVNEITEMQRLNEDRFKQEWTTFRADDQKRWANYALSQEEMQRELTRQLEKIAERVTSLEDASMQIRELSERIIEESKRQVQALVEFANQLSSSYERSVR